MGGMNSAELWTRARAAYEASQKFHDVKKGPGWDDKNFSPVAREYWLKVVRAAIEVVVPELVPRSPTDRRRLLGIAPLKSKHSLASQVPPGIASGSTELKGR